MRYDRTILAYHGCDAAVAERLLRGDDFRPSENDYDWLGAGVYFWEYGADRALRFARDQQGRGRVAEPAVVGAIVQLGSCFDLMDTRFAEELGEAYEELRAIYDTRGLLLPHNAGATPDRKLRRLDCSVLNYYFDNLKRAGGLVDTVRCGFTEGEPAYPGSGILQESHVQVAVRNPACILGVFRPRVLS